MRFGEQDSGVESKIWSSTDYKGAKEEFNFLKYMSFVNVDKPPAPELPPEMQAMVQQAEQEHRKRQIEVDKKDFDDVAKNNI